MLRRTTKSIETNNITMCKISDKLKLCTCAEDIDEVAHTWSLYRYIKGREVLMIGEVVMPHFIDDKVDKLNKKALLELVNRPNIFDKPIELKSKDRLVLSFDCSALEGKEEAPSYESRIAYGFEYKSGVWIEKEYDFFDWKRKHEELYEGKIELGND